MRAASNLKGDETVDKIDLESTNQLLRVIVAILIRGGDNPMSLKQQIEILSDAGMRPKDIATVLGKSGTHINKELTGIRRQKGKK
ncbi:hypothetical protein [Reyranella sp.]|uniref:hypothetical protein n=1 Tax=Reyranella sp. TaxID=1929291 RepID=UPI002F959B44